MQSETQSPILIQGAMEVECDRLIARLAHAEPVQIDGWDYCTGLLEDIPVVVARTRIGMVNATASTLLAIQCFHPCAVINQGTAGAHDPDFVKGDILIAKGVINGASIETAHLEKGQGVSPVRWRTLPVYAQSQGVEYPTEVFYADNRLLNAATEVSNRRQERVHFGILSSSDTWNRELDRILWSHRRLATSAEEMEAAAVAQICLAYDLPFLAIRIISNSEFARDDFDTTTAQICQEFVSDVAVHYTHMQKGV